jgi:hypothetical protein
MCGTAWNSAKLSLVSTDASRQDILFASFRPTILFAAERALFKLHLNLGVWRAAKHPADFAGAGLRGLLRGHCDDYQGYHSHEQSPHEAGHG